MLVRLVSGDLVNSYAIVASDSFLTALCKADLLDVPSLAWLARNMRELAENERNGGFGETRAACFEAFAKLCDELSNLE